MSPGKLMPGRRAARFSVILCCALSCLGPGCTQLPRPQLVLTTVDPTRLFGGEDVVISPGEAAGTRPAAADGRGEIPPQTPPPRAAVTIAPIYTDLIWSKPGQDASPDLRPAMPGTADAPAYAVLESRLLTPDQSNGIFLPLDDDIVILSRRTYTFEETGLTVIFESSVETDTLFQGRLRLRAFNPSSD